MNSYVLGFAFDLTQNESQNSLNTQVALIRKLKPAWQADNLNGIGGSIEEFDGAANEGANRTGLNAMVREFREETGFQTEPAAWHQFHTMGAEDWQVQCYRAFSIPLHKLKTTTEEEVIVVRAYSLPQDVLFNLRWLIPLALDPQPYPTMQVYR